MYNNNKYYYKNIPAMLIGIVDTDTIRVLSYKCFNDFKKGQFVQVISDQMFDEIIKPTKEPTGDIYILRLYPIKLTRNKKEDIYYCKVKNTIYGIIKN